ncbi:hypothetical protein B0F90DRAFT_1738028 [Multifurca ochricompacta]|uniref:BRCA2 OB1 domain-containing protein n=1 Tax=Multifurca ochricompacta TaxID=376703 RepID=A0AAD4M0Q5_9AGAM|nr:hypothetical protein B0F90DRAFT_1738028 [Multifurca ochricompacta]
MTRATCLSREYPLRTVLVIGPAPIHSPPLFPRQHQAMEHDDPNDPFTSTYKSCTGFISASAPHLQHMETSRLSSDPETGPNDRDEAMEDLGEFITPPIGFSSASGLVNSSVGFASASSLVRKSDSVTRHHASAPSHSQVFTYRADSREDSGFECMDDEAILKSLSVSASFGKKKVFQPSAIAMKAALEKVKRWEAEDGCLDPQGVSPEKYQNANISPHQALITVENVSPRRTDASQTSSVPVNPDHVISGHSSVDHHIPGFSSAGQAERGGTLLSAGSSRIPNALGNRSFQTPSASGVKGKASMKPFKSPLLNLPTVRSSGNSQSDTTFSTPNKEVTSTALVSFAFPSVVPTPGARFSTPQPIRSTPMQKRSIKKFVTPFKLGMRPGEPGHTPLRTRYDAEKVSAVVVASGSSTDRGQSTNNGTGKPTRRRFFDTTVPRDRKTLALSGLRPGTHGPEALACMGINVAELRSINPKSAIQYRFHLSSQVEPQGPSHALRELMAIGCTLATQEWVDNHWSLIIWKLAGMVALDPESEGEVVDRRRWSWAETMRQLRYRYEKELNGGARPALRLITTRDTPPAFHMILCVSDITWSESRTGEDGIPTVSHPTLELTDGWYCLRARVDEVLARAARRGVIRVGRKIAVSGASIPRDVEPCEVLEANNKVELNITGNGTHLAPWHAKLGFQSRPAIATLHSISPEGGMVPCLELVVTKVYPIAYIEFHKDGDGNITREGPRREKEELAAHDAWTRKREREYQRLRDEAEDTHKLYLDWAQRFEAKSGSWHPGEDEDMPGHIESMFDDCEYSSDPSSVLRRVSSRAEAGWLARFARERAEREREALELGLERELQSACPPREVRSFRVLMMRDARAKRRPAHRVVELTVWEVLSLAFDGVTAGQFKDGQRFQVTNLLPTQKNAWMDRHAEGSHVYLSTSKTSRWTKL